MSCEHSRKFIDAYMDGELETGTMLTVETHMEGCDACRALLALKRSMKRELFSVGARIRAPQHLRNQVMAISQGRAFKPWKAAIVVLPLAAAAALVFLILPGGTGDSEAQDQRVARVVADVVNRHNRELPMEVTGGDETQAESWFRGKVDFPVRASGVGLKNASFQGARVSNVQEQQAAHMTYTVDGHKVTLMIFPASRMQFTGGNLRNVSGRSVLTGTRNGYNVIMTSEDGMMYALSSDLPIERLIKLISNKAPGKR